MSILLTDALKQLDLKPGECRSVVVDDYEVEIRRPEQADGQTGPMLTIWLDVPPTKNARTVILQRGEPQLPRPIVIDDSDLAPE